MPIKKMSVCYNSRPLLLPETCGPSSYTPFILDNSDPKRELWRARSPYVSPEMDEPLLLGKKDSRLLFADLLRREHMTTLASGFILVDPESLKERELRKILAGLYPPVIIDPAKEHFLITPAKECLFDKTITDK